MIKLGVESVPDSSAVASKALTDLVRYDTFMTVPTIMTLFFVVAGMVLVFAYLFVSNDHIVKRIAPIGLIVLMFFVYILQIFPPPGGEVIIYFLSGYATLIIFPVFLYLIYLYAQLQKKRGDKEDDTLVLRNMAVFGVLAVSLFCFLFFSFVILWSHTASVWGNLFGGFVISFAVIGFLFFSLYATKNAHKDKEKSFEILSFTAIVFWVVFMIIPLIITTIIKGEFFNF